MAEHDDEQCSPGTELFGDETGGSLSGRGDVGLPPQTARLPNRRDAGRMRGCVRQAGLERYLPSRDLREPCLGSTVIVERGSATGTQDASWFSQQEAGTMTNHVKRLCAWGGVGSSNHLHLADRHQRVFPGVSEVSIRRLAASCLEVINRMGHDRFRLRWNDVVDATHGKQIALPKHGPVVCGSGVRQFTDVREVDQRSQDACPDLNKFKEDGWGPPVSDTDWADLVRCICQSVEHEDLVTLIRVLRMYVRSGMKFSAGSSMHRDMAQCEHVRRERFQVHMTDH